MKNRTLLMIPGPIEFEPAVLAALGVPTTSHVAPDFIAAFGQALERTREVFLAPDGQPFVVAGSGTLAMDMAAANLIEPGDRALVANSGFFGDRMGVILERYGAQVTHVRAAVGGAPDPAEVAAALAKDSYKLVTITQVDTSTGVLADVKALAAAAARARRAGGGGRRLLGGRRGAADGRLGRGSGVHRVAESDQRAAGAGAGGGAAGRAGRVQGAQDPGRQLLRRLDQLAADHGGVRGAQAGLLRHPGGQPGLGAERQPGPDPGGRHGRPHRPPRQAGPRLPGGHRRAGAGPGAAGARDRRAHDDRAALPRGRRRPGFAEAHRRRGRHPGRRSAPRHPRRVFPHRPHGADDAERCAGRDRGGRARLAGVRLPLRRVRGSLRRRKHTRRRRFL